jgi:hypothetical protein
MKQTEKTLLKIRHDITNIRYTDLFNLCLEYFGKPRQSGSSHAIFKTPWQGDPRINIQNSKGKAKAYQVKQVLAAIEKLQKSAVYKEDQNEY